MSTTIKCTCGVELKLPGNHSGGSGKCPNCGATINVKLAKTEFTANPPQAVESTSDEDLSWLNSLVAETDQQHRPGNRPTEKRFNKTWLFVGIGAVAFLLLVGLVVGLGLRRASPVSTNISMASPSQSKTTEMLPSSPVAILKQAAQVLDKATPEPSNVCKAMILGDIAESLAVSSQGHEGKQVLGGIRKFQGPSNLITPQMRRLAVVLADKGDIRAAAEIDSSLDNKILLPDRVKVLCRIAVAKGKAGNIKEAVSDLNQVKQLVESMEGGLVDAYGELLKAMHALNQDAKQAWRFIDLEFRHTRNARALADAITLKMIETLAATGDVEQAKRCSIGLTSRSSQGDIAHRHIALAAIKSGDEETAYWEEFNLMTDSQSVSRRSCEHIRIINGLLVYRKKQGALTAASKRFPNVDWQVKHISQSIIGSDLARDPGANAARVLFIDLLCNVDRVQQAKSVLDEIRGESCDPEIAEGLLSIIRAEYASGRRSEGLRALNRFESVMGRINDWQTQRKLCRRCGYVMQKSATPTEVQGLATRLSGINLACFLIGTVDAVSGSEPP